MNANRLVEIQIELMPLGHFISRYRVESSATDNGHAGWSDWHEEKNWFPDETVAESVARTDAFVEDGHTDVKVMHIGF
ncbi:hypothetical protein [Burkholderia cepacia]|uniref:hypothetical protein n=1 Tax=Burkholderia cepacia TaxID=292 RepID=UPI0012D8F0F7|nr:hypothetical protein [Burkholderia cepacia]